MIGRVPITMTPQGVEHEVKRHELEPPHLLPITMTPQGVEHTIRTVIRRFVAV